MLTTEAPELRKRLRPAWSPERLAEMYAQPHDHRLWGRGHGERVDKMVELGVALAYKAVDEYLTRFETVADLSCGNAEVVRRMGAELRILPEYAQLGDFAPGYQYHGPIERTINEILNVDLFVMGETLEHLDDPLAVLRQVREKTVYLLLSTPIDCWEDSNNDHYWAWSREGVEELFGLAGFTVVAHDAVDSRTYGEPYKYGIWVCR